MTRNTNTWLLTVIGLSSALSFNAMAAENGDKLLIEIGTLSSDVDTILRIDGTGGNAGTSIDLEEDLGFETGKQINRLDLRYRFTDKHSLKYSFFQLNRSAVHNIDRTIVIGDTEFPVQLDITARFDYRIDSVSYGYSLLANDDSNLDLLAGLYFIGTRFDISGSGGKEESFDGNGPLPLIGLNYERNLSGNWNLGTRATIFKLDTGDINGSVFDARIRVDYQFTEMFGLGLAWNWQRLNAGVEDSILKSDFDMTVSGAEITAVLRF